MIHYEQNFSDHDSHGLGSFEVTKYLSSTLLAKALSPIRLGSGRRMAMKGQQAADASLLGLCGQPLVASKVIYTQTSQISI